MSFPLYVTVLFKKEGSDAIHLSFKYFIHLFLERGERKEKERERNINMQLPLTCPQQGT